MSVINNKPKINNYSKKRKKHLNNIIIILIAISMLNMISAASFVRYGSKVRSHFFHLILFFLIYFFFAKIMPFLNKKYKIPMPYKFLNNTKVNAFILLSSLSILFFMIIYKFLGKITVTNGAYAWIKIFGVSVQPSELLKCFFIINMANFLDKTRKYNFSDGKLFLYSLFFLGSYAGLTVMQNDIGTALHYVSIWAFMMFTSQINIKKILYAITFVFSSTFISMIYVYNVFKIDTVKDYKIKRIISYIDVLFKNEYHPNVAYQIKQSIYAFGNGGLFGKGYFNGVQKYHYLPEIHTDFIMATVGEEFGIIGVLFVISCFLYIFNLAVETSKDSNDYFIKFLALGLGAHIISQVLINIFVAVGLLPVFGIPMPILSSGGTSLVTIAIILGLLSNINSD